MTDHRKENFTSIYSVLFTDSVTEFQSHIWPRFIRSTEARDAKMIGRH